MRIDLHSWRFRSAGRIGSLPTFALTFALSAFVLAARAQTIGPITPHPSAEPQQTPPESAAPAPDRDSKGTLAGRWNLNKDQSDDPRQKLEQASSSGRGGGWGQGPAGGGGGGWGGLGGPWGGMGGGPGGNGGGWNRGGRQFPDDGGIDMSDFSQLTIEQSDSSAKVTGGTGRVLAQYIGNSDKSSQDAKKSKDGPNTLRPRIGRAMNSLLWSTGRAERRPRELMNWRPMASSFT